MFSRVGTYTLNQSLLFDYNRVQSNMALLNKQISSGRQATIFKELNGSVERVNAYEHKLKTSAQYLESNAQIKARLQVMGEAVDSVIESTDDAINLMIQSLSATGAQYPMFAQAMEAAIDVVVAQLNTNIGGSYLFGGGRTTEAPVERRGVEVSATGVVDTQYYQGDNERTTARVSDTLLLDYGVRANDEAFANVLASMRFAMESLRSGNTEGIKQALQIANNAAVEVNAVKARIDGNSVILMNADVYHNATIAYVRGVYGTEVNTDTVTATAELAINDAILQASFQSFARITSLKLTDFLR